MIVIAIILIIATIALPKLNRAKMYAHETAAIKTLRTIHTAQTQYQSQFGRFATSLTELGPPQSGQPGPQAADLIDNNLASGEKSGYKFTVTGNPVRLCDQRGSGRLQLHRQPHVLFGSDHADPPELRPRAGDGADPELRN